MIVRRLCATGLFSGAFLLASAGSANITGSHDAFAAPQSPTEISLPKSGLASFETSATQGAQTQTPSESQLHLFADQSTSTERLRTIFPDDRHGVLLTAADIKLYQEIFALQKQGAWDEANKRIGRLSDTTLMGYVLFQKYMHKTKWRSKFTELANWMKSYADLPIAPRIYELGLKRKPSSASLSKPIRSKGLSGSNGTAGLQNSFDIGSNIRGLSYDAKTQRLAKQINKWLKARRLNDSLKLLRSSHGRKLANKDYDLLQAHIAARYFYLGHLQKSFDLAKASADRSGTLIAQANWIAGLSAWRLGKISEARHYFQQLSEIEKASPWDQAAGAYWTARALMREGTPQYVSKYLYMAAEHKETFYGMLAHGALGIAPQINWKTSALSDAAQQKVASTKRLKRIVALLQLGQHDWAEQEMMMMHPGRDQDLADAMAAIADIGQLARSGLRVSGGLKKADGGYFMNTLYPVPPWQPETGFSVDRALIYSFMRQESRFNKNAKSGVGALGLMQIMPTTASYISPTKIDFSKSRNKSKLLTPTLNVTLGDRYINYLLSKNGIDNNLIIGVASYNAGPGNIRKWRARINADHDPLLFLESIPSRETRHFVEVILLNLWTYRDRFGQEQSELKALAAGDWPRYEHQDTSKEPLWLVQAN